MQALCVSIHDVAPATLAACRDIAAAVEDVDESVPLTLLVVPHYHGDIAPPSTSFREWIESRLARGDEIALHGLTHRDESARPRGLPQRWRRSVYTAAEGEFSALTREEAAARIAQGREWLGIHGWHANGFVAPAWLMSEGAWAAVRSAGFVYTTTLARFHLLEAQRAIVAPTVVYSARSAPRRILSRTWNSALAALTRRAPIVRIGFHPADAAHPELMRHALQVLAGVARRRSGMTKSAFAREAAKLMH